MIKIKPLKSFAKIDQLLNRTGVAIENKKTLYTSAVLIQHPETGDAYIASFKELLAMQHGTDDTDEETINRLNNICHIFKRWGLIDVLDKLPPYDTTVEVKILKQDEAEGEWTIVKKYTPNPAKVARAFGLGE